MRKIFYIVLVAVLINFSMVPVANAEILTPESSTVKNSDVTLCGYALFAQRKEILRTKIKTNQIILEREPDNKEARHKLASVWHNLGRIYYAEEEYKEALDAFNEAVKLEPDNAEYKKDRDEALAKVKSGAKKSPPLESKVPKFNGLG